MDIKPIQIFVKTRYLFLFLISHQILFNTTFGKIKEMSTDSGNYLIQNKLRGTQVILIYNSRTAPRYLECLQMISQLRSKMSNKITFQSLDIAMIQIQNKKKVLPKIRRNSESLRIPISDSEIFNKNISISQKLIPIGVIDNSNDNLPFSNHKPVTDDQLSFSDQVKNSEISKAFSRIFSNFSFKRNRISDFEENKKVNRQHCSWILRINSHPIPFNEISYDYKDILHWLNKRIHRHPN